MADNGWIYNGRVSATVKSPEWIWKTQMLVKQLARGKQGKVRPLCPCDRCKRRHRHGKNEMYKHLVQYGYMADYVLEFNFDQFERDRSDVMRQRINGFDDPTMLTHDSHNCFYA